MRRAATTDAESGATTSAACRTSSEGDALTLVKLEPQGHETNPPARYTEATLVRTLEELGIGRPSTYASILGTILDRGYVFKKGTALVPAFLAFTRRRAARAALRRLVDYGFTASMEDDLDRIAAGERGARRVAAPLLLRATATARACTTSCRTSARSTRARSTRS